MLLSRKWRTREVVHILTTAPCTNWCKQYQKLTYLWFIIKCCFGDTTGYTTVTVLTVRVYLTVFLIVTSTGEVMGRVLVCVTQYLPYHTLCKSQYVLTPISRAWSVPHTYPINKHLTVHCTCPAQAVCRYG